MPKWAEDGTQVVTPPDAKIERGFTRGQGVSVGHLNWALSQAWDFVYSEYPETVRIVGGDLSLTHASTPYLVAASWGYDSSSGGYNFFNVGTYTGGTVDNPSGTFDAFIEWDTLNDTLEVTTTSVDFAFTTEFKVDGPTVSGADHEAKINQADTGFSLQSSHGFEAKALRVNTSGLGTDGRRYAYPTTDALQLTSNLSPVGQGWVSVEDPTVAGSSPPDQIARANILFSGSYYNLTSEGYRNIPGSSTANGYGIRHFLQFPINEEATLDLITLTGLRIEVDGTTWSGGEELNVELVSKERNHPHGVAPDQELLVTMVTKTSSGFSEEVWGTAEGSTGSWTLELNNYYYYIQIRLRNGTLVGIRDLDLTYEKRAVE